jgi:2-phosphosulfolactate phosphatase
MDPSDSIRILEGIEGARRATGHVVVIDVLRAFTTAAYGFAAGLDEIELVSTVEEALARPGFRMGEVGGKLIPGFDHNNSPAGLLGRRLSGRAVLRTGAGTQCVVAATGATTLWLASLVVATATVRALRNSGPVALVVSGSPDEGEEDRAAAEVIEALLRGTVPDFEGAVRRVRSSRAAARHAAGDPDRPIEDLDCATRVDAFDFAMRVDRREGRLFARAIRQVERNPPRLA